MSIKIEYKKRSKEILPIIFGGEDADISSSRLKTSGGIVWHIDPSDKWCYTARVIASRKLGRPIKKTEKVTFADGNPFNLMRENVVVKDRGKEGESCHKWIYPNKGFGNYTAHFRYRDGGAIKCSSKVVKTIEEGEAFREEMALKFGVEA